MKIKKSKLIICVIIISLIPLCLGGCWNLRVCPQKSEKQVEEKINSLYKQFDGDIWDRDYIGIECFSFAHYIFNHTFERGDKELGTFTHYGENVPMWILEDRQCDVYIAEQLNPDYSKDKINDFFANLKTGDYLQLQWRKYIEIGGKKLYGYHSAIVYKVDMENKKITLLDANYVDKLKVAAHDFTFDEFYQKTFGCTAYRYWNYIG